MESMRYEMVRPPDAVALIAYGSSGVVLWKRGVPTVDEWQGVWSPPDIAERLAKGRYVFVNGETDDSVTVVFCPYGGLDFNLRLDKRTGALLGAPVEAR